MQKVGRPRVAAVGNLENGLTLIQLCCVGDKIIMTIIMAISYCKPLFTGKIVTCIKDIKLNFFFEKRLKISYNYKIFLLDNYR